MLARVLDWVAGRLHAILTGVPLVYWLLPTFLATLVAGILLGNWMSDNHLKARFTQALEAALDNPQDRLAHQRVDWQPLSSNLLDLKTATIQLAPFETNGRGGAIDEVAGGVLFASPTGQLGYLSPAGQLTRLDLQVPLNWEGLRQSPISRKPGFLNLMFRVLDLLAVERSDGQYDLYVSHHRFANECFEIAVSRARLTARNGKIQAASPDWEEVFVASPCVPPKATGMLFEGNESGGRLVLKDARTLLLALGDLQFNGVDDPRKFAQDPKADLGKVIAIDLDTRQKRIVSSGHRNPQGLLVARDGTVWETEHGPQGGDELNIIHEGSDYGWPTVTYGVQYAFGGGRRVWPANPVQGRHDGFEQPVFSFVPSISISNLVEPDPNAFPLWRDHLVIGSLYSGQSLYLARIEGGKRVAYVEPIRIKTAVRDMIAMRDGSIAILNDHGQLILLRNAERTDGVASVWDHMDAVEASPAVLETVAQHASATHTAAELGEELFVFSCSSCHSLSGVMGVGPPLNGVVGRRIGSVKGYSYSEALATADRDWTARRLADFLVDPPGQYPGTNMPPTGLNWNSAQALADFLSRSE